MLAPDKRLGRLPPALHGRRVAFELPHPVFEIAVVARLREIRLALARRDDVVGRRDEGRKRTCGRFGVAKRSKRTDRRHEADATKRAPVARTSDARRRNEPPTTERVSATSGASDVAVAREAARRFLAAGPMRGRRVRVRVRTGPRCRSSFPYSASRDRSIEFALGFTEEQAQREASRCLRCDLAYLCPSIKVIGADHIVSEKVGI